MQESGEFFAIINEQQLKLKVTLGFWKHCGFKREEANVIENDQNHYFNALKLAIFYGNKKQFNWNCFEDMEKNFPESSLEDCETDYSQEISMAMVHYMPKKLRDITLKKIKEMELEHEKLLDAALNTMDEVVEEANEPECHEPSDDSKKK